MNKLNYYFYFFLVSILIIVPTKTYSDNHNLNEILELIQKDLRTLERAVYSEDFISSQETTENINNRQHHIKMNGREVFKHAVRRFPEVIMEGLDYNNLTIEDVDLVIPHQANFRITQAVQKQLKINQEKVFSNIHNYGNTTAASIGIALSEALEQNKINDGDIVVLASFGAGFQWGSVIIKW